MQISYLIRVLFWDTFFLRIINDPRNKLKILPWIHLSIYEHWIKSPPSLKSRRHIPQFAHVVIKYAHPVFEIVATEDQ